MGLSETLVKILRHDAFIMELANYMSPWFAFEPFKIIYDAYQDRIFKLFHQNCFSAMAIELPQPKEHDKEDKALVFSFYAKGINNVETIRLKKEVIPSPDWVDWLWEQTSKVIKSTTSLYSDEYSTALAAWLNVGVNFKLFLIPYIVQECNEQWFIDLRQDPHKEYGKIDPEFRRRFLYTTPIELYPHCENLPTFQGAYFKSAWVIGFEDNGDHLENEVDFFLEALSIMFQLSWGYPQLLKDKEEMAKKTISFQELEEIRQDAYYLTAKLMRIGNDADRLMAKLEPRPLEKVEFLKRVAKYIPPIPQEYYQRWIFHHVWSAPLIQENTEDFKAHFSCILLSHLGLINLELGGKQTWPSSEVAPWVLLKERISKTRHFVDIKSTIDKVVSGIELDWNTDDEASYNYLKGIFHYPTKDGNLEKCRMTGPLLLFWAREKDAKILDTSTEKFLYSNTKGGIGWPHINAFIGMDGIQYISRKKDPKNTEILISYESVTWKKKVIRIKLTRLETELVRAIDDIMNGLITGEGDLKTYVEYITNADKTTLTCEYNKMNSCVNIEFTVSV